MDSIEQEVKGLCEKLATHVLKDNASPTQLAFERIASELGELRAEKVRVYGESAYENDDVDEDLLERMLDVKRKFMRVRQLTRLLRAGDLSALPSLVDAYRDIANYGIMAVQVLEIHYPKQALDLS